MKIKTNKELKFATDGSAAVDLCCIEQFVLGGGETRLVKTGVRVEIPDGFVGLVCSRSGLAAKNEIFVLNAPGVIDSDYRGEIGVILHNAGRTVTLFDEGHRIAQLMIVPYLIPEYVVDDSHSDTTRGTGGFGSTGH